MTLQTLNRHEQDIPSVSHEDSLVAYRDRVNSVKGKIVASFESIEDALANTLRTEQKEWVLGEHAHHLAIPYFFGATIRKGGARLTDRTDLFSKGGLATRWFHFDIKIKANPVDVFRAASPMTKLWLRPK